MTPLPLDGLLNALLNEDFLGQDLARQACQIPDFCIRLNQSKQG